MTSLDEILKWIWAAPMLYMLNDLKKLKEKVDKAVSQEDMEKFVERAIQPLRDDSEQIRVGVDKATDRINEMYVLMASWLNKNGRQT